MNETHTPQENAPAASGKTYWRNIEEFTRDPNRAGEPEPEFALSPTRDESDKTGLDENSRREFLKLMGAGLMLAGTSACTRRPVEKIVPYVQRPEEVVPGVSVWYSSASADCPCGCGLLVKTREGRPIKFEGNPKHPVTQGGLCVRAQASILNLYDPDRLQAPLAPARKGTATGAKWQDLDSAVVGAIRSGRGRVRVLTGELRSPTTEKLISEFVSGVGGKHVVYDAMGSEEIMAASQASYGTRVVPRYDLAKADAIVSFGADFLGSWLSPAEFNRGFAANRKVGKNAPKGESKTMSKFVAFEAVFTLAGSNADERYRLKSGDEYKAALALAHELIVAGSRTRFAGNGDVTGALAPYAVANVASKLGIPADVFKKTAQVLWENRGKSIVFGGGDAVKGDVGVALELAVNLLNSALENEGSTIDGAGSPRTDRSSYPALAQLVSDMKSGQVDVLVLYKANPAYALPAALGFNEALAKVKTVVSFTDQFDETARNADYVGATPHHTEAWGDISTYRGVSGIQQPTISPLYAGTRGLEDSMLIWGKQLGLGLGGVASYHEYLKANWSRQGVGAMAWDNVLREGFHGSLSSARGRSFSTASLRGLPKLAWNNSVTLALYAKSAIGDGRYANNGWLQELPDPVTKVTWDNYASMSPAAAQKLGVKDGDVVRVKTDKVTLELPAHVQPGMHDQTVAIAVGYGRKGAGRVGDDVGVNAFPIAVQGSNVLNMAGLPVTVEKGSGHRALASTQKHHSLENRPIVKEASLKQYQKNPKAGNEHHHELVTMWPKFEYAGYRWGMAIDLNSCTGCSACIIGCQSENNIPIVGKKFVLDSKEMHWLRIDRYYSGNLENPETVHQPMLCQHCENAPCETVCPVLATMHDHEGLNQQIYNRCVGTRYCANNCPYKVRRFNWFTFTDYAKPLNLSFNPDLSVRTRGVMEKCTFCIQRITDAKDHAKDEGRKVKDGELKTACQQSCPTDAIIFGDINDKNSRVSQIGADPRGFHVLEELNVRPSVTYLTKIRNVESTGSAGHGSH